MEVRYSLVQFVAPGVIVCCSAGVIHCYKTSMTEGTGEEGQGEKVGHRQH